MAAESDQVAKDVAGTLTDLLDHGGAVVSLCGYVHLHTSWKPVVKADGTLDVNDGSARGAPVAEVHLYTSKSFDQWLEIPEGSVRSRRAGLSEYDGRSEIFVDIDATVKHCRRTNVADVAQSMSSGVEDPTAYPRKPSG